MTLTKDRSRTPTALARAGWLRLRTMRTAIILLLLLGAGSSGGSFFPQRPVQPQEVVAWIERNPGWAPLAEDLGLFDVFGSWWFMGLAVLLLTSLIGCLVPRYRAFARVLRTPPRASEALDRRDAHHVGVTDAPVERVMAAAEGALRARRYRIARHPSQIAADRGNAREGGSLVFHTAFLVLLLGMAVGKLFGSTGQVAVIEGETFSDTRIEYDSLEIGRFAGAHSGVRLTLDDFDVTWHPNGVPERFVSRVRVDDGTSERSAEIYVNSPLTFGALRFYQLSWGWAPVVRVAQHGRVLYEGPTIFLPRSTLWRGVAKIPGTRPQQMGFDMLLFTSPDVTADGEPRNLGPEPKDPLLVFEQFLGDLGLDRPQSIYELDPRGLAAAEAGALRIGQTRDLPNGVSVSFLDLQQYSVFQVAMNPGAPILLGAALLILVALLPALYSSRRRIWVRVDAQDGRTRIEIAGHALQRTVAFADEFEAVVRDLDRRLTLKNGARDG